MSDAALHMLGLARKAGRIEVGEEPVGAVCRARKAKVLLLACDAADNTARRAEHFAQAGNTLCVSVPFTKEQMGGAVGRASCAMAALTDAGMAASFLNKLAAVDPERYGEAASALDTKAQKVLQRQREQRQHEKNLAKGKQKPWCAPPKSGK
ncbi:MAG: L7Ae/L30e/S12e/Gadd45 family ribosomal protein [Oscillospiraceae bacterium]